MMAVATNRKMHSACPIVQTQQISWLNVRQNSKLRMFNWYDLEGDFRDSVHYRSGALIADGLNHCLLDDLDGTFIGTDVSTKIYSDRAEVYFLFYFSEFEYLSGCLGS